MRLDTVKSYDVSSSDEYSENEVDKKMEDVSIEYVSDEDDSSCSSDSSSSSCDSSSSSEGNDGVSLIRSMDTMSDNDKFVKVKYTKNEPNPLVIRFENRVPRSLKDLNSNLKEKEDKLMFLQETVRNHRSSSYLKVRAKDRNFKYEGTYDTTKPRQGQEPFMRQYIGIYDKVTGKLTVQKASHNGFVYQIKQSLKSNKDHDADTDLSTQDRKRKLIESFGSAKKKRLQKEMETSRVGSKSLFGLKGDLEKSIQDHQISDSNLNAITKRMNGETVNVAEQSLLESMKEFLPPYDDNTRTPCDIYTTKSIAGDALYAKLLEDMNLLTDEDWKSQIMRNEMFQNVKLTALSEIIQKMTCKPQPEQAVTLLLLVEFSFLHRVVGFKSRLPLSVPHLERRYHIQSCERFCDLFATQVNKIIMFDKELRHKRYLFLLVLFIKCVGSQFMNVSSMKEFLEGLLIDPKVASKLLRAAGFQVKLMAAGDFSVSLKAPLVLPKGSRRSMY